MSDGPYLKCSCRKCGTHIEFPAAGIGETIDCPNCGEKITLISDDPVSAPSAGENPSESVAPGASAPKPRAKLFAAVVSALLVVILVPTGLALHRSKTHPSVQPMTTNGTTQVPTNSRPSTPPALAEYETNHFRVSPITLEKAEGGGITYAVGTLTNDSDRQRFGVKITLDVMGADGHKIGSASDYLAVLEPSNQWRFRALLNEPGVSGVKVSGIGEQK